MRWNFAVSSVAALLMLPCGMNLCVATVAADKAIRVGYPQVPQNPVRVQVNLVNVPVSVEDRQGQPVAGLHRDDFSLTEDGHSETIRVFQATAVHPLSMVMAIDTSVSVRTDLAFAKQAAAHLIASLLGGDDRVELLGFAGDVTQVVPFTANLRQLDHGLRTLHGDGPTALYAAIARAANELAPQSGRKVIVVISDGSNSVTDVDYEQARTAALRAQASIESVILVPIGANAGRDLGGEHALIQLARDTGGQYFYADGAISLRDAMKRLSLALRSEYLLGYYPSQQLSAASGFRRIQLRLTKPAVRQSYRLQYRTGYYAEGAR
ncbi:MAG TPA: VWA domain-containing protein [Acidobacteriaceae bacterium]|nr:VWA domain-containing protein [Acidobacteriaceae bacterium]